MQIKGTELDQNSFEKIIETTNEFLNKFKFRAQISRDHNKTNETVFIEPCTSKVNNVREDFFDGMQILLFQNYNEKNDWIFEVSEYQAGKKQNEMHIYCITKNLNTALKSLVKGNKRKPIQVIK